MKQLRITWDPIEGLAVADGLVAKEIDSLIDVYRQPHIITHRYRVGSDALINEIRLRICRGELSHKEVVFIVDGLELNPLENGRLKFWPKGFCDLTLKQVMELARTRRTDVKTDL